MLAGDFCSLVTTNDTKEFIFLTSSKQMHRLFLFMPLVLPFTIRLQHQLANRTTLINLQLHELFIRRKKSHSCHFALVFWLFALYTHFLSPPFSSSTTTQPLAHRTSYCCSSPFFVRPSPFSFACEKVLTVSKKRKNFLHLSVCARALAVVSKNGLFWNLCVHSTLPTCTHGAVLCVFKII